MYQSCFNYKLFCIEYQDTGLTYNKSNAKIIEEYTVLAEIIPNTCLLTVRCIENTTEESLWLFFKNHLYQQDVLNIFFKKGNSCTKNTTLSIT